MNITLRRLDVAYLAGTIVLFVCFFRFTVPGFPFSYDESDYMTAARKGIAGNYLESTSMTLPEFVATGLSAVRGQLGNAGLSEYVRGRKDLTFYRHYHGPLYYHWLATVSKLVNADEVWMRASGAIFHLLTFLTLYIGMLWLVGEAGRPGAVLVSMLYLFCVNNIYTAAELSSHVLFIWLSILALILIARFAQTATRRWFFAALAVCTVALCALEYAVLLYASLGAAVVLVRKDFFRGLDGRQYRRWVIRSLATVFGTVLILWPAGLLKGTLPEGFLYIGYLAKFRKGSFGNVTALDVWADRFRAWPLDFALLFAALLCSWVLLWNSRHRRMLLPVLIYPTLLLLTTAKNTAGAPRYISSLFAPVYFVVGALLVERLYPGGRRVFIASAAVLFGVLCVADYRLTVVPAQRMRPPSEIELLIGFVRQHRQQSFAIPALFLPTLQYYFPETEIRPDSLENEPHRPDQNSKSKCCDFVCSYGKNAANSAFETHPGGGGVALDCAAN